MNIPRELLLLLEKAGLENKPDTRELLLKALREAIGAVRVSEPLWMRTLTNTRRPQKAHMASGEELIRLAIERVKDKSFEKKVIRFLLKY